MRVVLADDSLLLREGVARLLEEAGLEVVAQAGDGEDLLRKVGAHKPDVAIVDVRMPPTHTDEGLRAAAEIRDKHPGTGVLVLGFAAMQGLDLVQMSEPVLRDLAAETGETVNLGVLYGDQVLFVVHSAQITYHKPALLNDALTVTAKVARVGRVRLEFEQSVRRGEEVLASAWLTLACVSATSHRLVPVPDPTRKKLEDTQ